MTTTWPKYSKTEVSIAKKIIQSNKVNYWTGQQGRKFEKDFSKYFDIKYSVAIANASLGLECALKALDIKKNDEIIVPCKSFIASASCVINVGAKLVFADVDYNSQNISHETIKSLITKKTKAIICVHLGGFPCDMVSIKQICKKKKIKIIEDCSQAHGAKIDQKYVGTFGDISVWSFCNDKIISSAGEGGMIATNNLKLFKRIWELKEIGKKYDLMKGEYPKNKYRWVHKNFGTNLRLTEIQSAIGRFQLKRLQYNIKIRNRNALKLINNLKKFSCIEVPSLPKNYTNAYYRLYVKIIPKKLKKKWTKIKIIEAFLKKNIECSEGSCSELYKERCFKIANIIIKKSFKNARKLSIRSIAFNVDPGISNKRLNYIIINLNKIFKNASKR